MANTLQTQFNNALWKGQHNKIEQLILQGADVNADEDGWPPIITIASRDKIRVKCIDVLVQYGADVNVLQKTENNLPQAHTALMYAAKNQGYAFDVCNEGVKCLVKHGASIDQQSTTGKTALMYAVNQRRIANAEFLIERGANINMQDEQGFTPLMLCFERSIPLNDSARNLTFKQIQSLMDRDADISLKNRRGHDVLQMAKNMGRQDVVDFIKGYHEATHEKERLLNDFSDVNENTPVSNGLLNLI